MLLKTFFRSTCYLQWICGSLALRNGLYLIEQDSSTTAYTDSEIPSYNISIPVDHFNDSDPRTYSNRYWINDTYYQPGGPVFFYDNGEEGVSEAVVAWTLAEVNKTSAVMRLAEKYNGTAVLWEHRYYGLSFPIPLNLSTDEPQGGIQGYEYLTVDQALEDVVYFANTWKPDGCSGDECDMVRPSKTPWIWVGGSYPGIRGAFLRIRNPEIIYATWSSCAPVEARYDGSLYFTPMASTLPPNCSVDIKAAVALADEIMSGSQGNETFEFLQRLTSVTQQTYNGLNESYYLSYADSYDPFTIGEAMVRFFDPYFQSGGPANTTDPFCSYLGSYNPSGTPSNTSDPYISILSNPGDGVISSASLTSSYNSTVALHAYFYALRRWHQDILYGGLDSTPTQSPPHPLADLYSWDYQVVSQFGWFLGSNPDNVTIVSRYYNTSSTQMYTLSTLEDPIDPGDLPSQPDLDAFLKYGGWNMTPSNVMFTDGQFDPWRGGTVMSDYDWAGAPLRNVTQQVPQCGLPPNGTDVFGVIYPDAVHVPDLAQWAWIPYDESSPVFVGVELFQKALDVWLPCFNASTSEL